MTVPLSPCVAAVDITGTSLFFRISVTNDESDKLLFSLWNGAVMAKKKPPRSCRELATQLCVLLLLAAVIASVYVVVYFVCRSHNDLPLSPHQLASIVTTGLTKTGNGYVRRIPIEAAQYYRHRPVLSAALRKLQGVRCCRFQGQLILLF